MSVQDNIQRTVLPIPDRPRTGLVTYDAKDPDSAVLADATGHVDGSHDLLRG
jgi:hypothetical protein